MKRFQNILVAVDLSQDDRLVTADFAPHSQHAVQEAMWLATRSGARLTFFYSLDVSERTQRLIEEDEGLMDNVLEQARRVLRLLVDRAAAEGVQADSQVTFGKSWLELIRHVLHHDNDLLIAGTRHRSRLQSTLFGSTGMKLLRKCPCPVWITQPRPHRKLNSLVIASDLSPVSNLAIDLAASVALEYHAEMHVVHAINSASANELRAMGLPLERVDEHLTHERHWAEQELQIQLQRPAVQELENPPHARISSGEPEVVILDMLTATKADLLVMATIGRSGIPGMVIGNTAERLLPSVNCSVLAVKPVDFVAPVTFS